MASSARLFQCHWNVELRGVPRFCNVFTKLQVFAFCHVVFKQKLLFILRFFGKNTLKCKKYMYS